MIGNSCNRLSYKKFVHSSDKLEEMINYKFI